MIKDELLHTHQLLSIVADHFEEDREIAVPEEEYEDIEVGPYEVFENKSNHEEAVVAFGEDIEAALAESAAEAGEEEATVAN